MALDGVKNSKAVFTREDKAYIRFALHKARKHWYKHYKNDVHALRAPSLTGSVS